MVNYRNDEAFEIKGYWSDSERLFDNPTGEDSIAGTLSYLREEKLHCSYSVRLWTVAERKRRLLNFMVWLVSEKLC